MTTIEHAGQVMMHVQQGNHAFARTIAAALRTISAPAAPARDTTLSGPSFQQLEPGLARETARIPTF